MINYTLFLLGVVDSLLEDGNLKVLHFTQTNKIGSQWSLPEKVDVQSTSMDQVLCKVDKVGYQSVHH